MGGGRFRERIRYRKGGRVNGDEGDERRKERRQRKEEKEQKVHEKRRNQRHHLILGSPGTPLATPFLLPPLYTLPCTTPLDDSRHSSHPLPLPLHLSHSFLDLVSRTPSTSRRTSTLYVLLKGVTLLLRVISVRATAKLLLTFRSN